MLKNNFNKILPNLIIVIFIFVFDRLSKLYILNLLEREQVVSVYINQFMNLNLIWNTVIGFGLLSSDSNFYYNLVVSRLMLLLKPPQRPLSAVTGITR